jgi:hypothetical protein
MLVFNQLTVVKVVLRQAGGGGDVEPTQRSPLIIHGDAALFASRFRLRSVSAVDDLWTEYRD